MSCPPKLTELLRLLPNYRLYQVAHRLEPRCSRGLRGVDDAHPILSGGPRLKLHVLVVEAKVAVTSAVQQALERRAEVAVKQCVYQRINSTVNVA